MSAKDNALTMSEVGVHGLDAPSGCVLAIRMLTVSLNINEVERGAESLKGQGYMRCTRKTEHFTAYCALHVSA